MKRFSIITVLLLSACIFNEAGAQLDNSIKQRRTVRLALVLPFNSASDSPSSDCMDFYCGALAAVEAKKEEGINVKLKVIDYTLAKKDLDSFSDKIADCDAVIGPITVNDIETVLPYCKAAGVPFISPLDQKAEDLASNEPLFFQVPPSAKVQATNLVESMAYRESGSVTVIYRNEEETYANEVTAALDSLLIPYRKFVSGDNNGNNTADSLCRTIKPTARHHIIIASENQTFASEVTKGLIGLKNSNYDVHVYGCSKIRKLESLESKLFHNINMHISAGYYINRKDPVTKKFINRYRTLFHGEPSQYSFSGYDIFTFFISAYNDLGTSFYKFIPYYSLNLQQCNIMFKSLGPQGGFINCRTRDIEYLDDFSVEVR